MHPCPDCLGDPQHFPCPTCGAGSETVDLEIWYEPCPFGCCYGTVVAVGNVEFECPVCAGGGVGRPHAHEHIEVTYTRPATVNEARAFINRDDNAFYDPLG